MDRKFVIAKVRKLLDERGISLTKFGETLGSRGGQQSKIDRANRFLRAEQKSVSLDEIQKLAQFFDKPTSFFLPISELREEQFGYGKITQSRISKMPPGEVADLLDELILKNPDIFGKLKIKNLEPATQRAFLRAFYFQND